MGISDVLSYALFESAEQMAEMSARDLRRKLRDNDCVELRQSGSHLQVKCGGCQSTVPVHGSTDIKKGTLKSIERSLGACLGPKWTKVEFLDDDDATVRIVEGEELDEGKKKKGGGSESLGETIRKIGVFTKTQGGVIKAYANRVAEHAGEAPPQSREAVAKLQGLMAQLDATISQVAALAAEVERKG
jgi:predicted RNA binding protein YcfA (HicA-like mRNA interferase family)